MSFTSLRKPVGNFVSANPQMPINHEGQVVEKKAQHSPLPMDPIPYSGSRHTYIIVDLDVAKTNMTLGMGHSPQLSDITSHYLPLVSYYQQGFNLEKVVEVPGMTKISMNGSSSMPFQAVFSRAMSQYGSNTPVPSWELKVVKCTLHTKMAHGVIDASLGKKNDISNTSGIITTIFKFAGKGARLVGLEYSGDKQTHAMPGNVPGQKESLAVDVFFNFPLYHNPVSYVYQCVNVPVRIAYLGPGKFIKVECNWKGMMDSYLQQGWRLVDIFWDQGKRSCAEFTLSEDHNSVWFFEKEASKLSNPQCIYEGCVVEYFHTVKVAWTGAKGKCEWGQLLMDMGSRGWELSTIVETPEVKNMGYGNIIFKMLFFFQRKKLQQQGMTPPSSHFSQPQEEYGYHPAYGYQTPTSYQQRSPGQSQYGSPQYTQSMGHQQAGHHQHMGHSHGPHPSSNMGPSNSNMGLHYSHAQMGHYQHPQMGHAQNGVNAPNVGLQNGGNVPHMGVYQGPRHNQHTGQSQNGYYDPNRQGASVSSGYGYQNAPPPYTYSMPPTSQPNYSSGYYTPLAHYPPDAPR